MKNKVHAFTLNEMLVVLLITVIIIGMAFSVLSLVQRQMHSIGDNFKSNTSLNLLRHSLWIDFNQSDGVWYEQHTDELFFVNGLRETRYGFHNTFITKDTDTFKINIRSKQFRFKGNTQESGEVDALDIFTGIEKESKHLFVYKTNSATSYLNQ